MGHPLVVGDAQVCWQGEAADPSTPLRFAQDDTLWFVARTVGEFCSQGLKPPSCVILCGTAEDVPLSEAVRASLEMIPP